MKHHGRGLFQITKNKSLVEAMETDYRRADVPKKDIAMLEYAEKLTRDPCNVTRGQCGKLRDAGFRDADILDIVQVTAYYNYVNRMACGLGVELESWWRNDD